MSSYHGAVKKETRSRLNMSGNNFDDIGKAGKNLLLPLVLCLSVALAEPPVGDGYPAARSGHEHHDHHDSHGFDFQRSLSQEYGPPAASISRSFGSSRNSLSQEYGPPAARSGALPLGPSSRNALSTSYGAPAARSISQEYGVPNARSSARSSISQEYGVPSARSISQEYAAPSTRGISQEYNAPNSRASSFSNPRSGLSQEYGPPGLRNADSYTRAPSSQYGTPEFRSGPSEGYLPPQRSFGSISQKYGAPSQFRSSPSQQYGVPSARNNAISSYSSSSSKSFGSRSSIPRTPSQSYGTPSSRSLSTQYGLPATARGSDSYSQGFRSQSTYSAPPATARSLSDTYGAPGVASARGVSQEYGAPSRAADLTTNAFASSFASARSSPSEKYGAPSVRDSMPSEEYGVPDQYSSLSNQGYGYARNALDELLNQEPANYDFGYKVNDYITGSDFGHTESRQENRAEGSYFVVLPDGTKQIVEYEADERGFKPRISVEPADVSARAGGYDDNAADIARNVEGPY